MKIFSKNNSKLWIQIRNTQTRWSADKTPALIDCGPDVRDRGINAVDPFSPDKSYKEPRVVIVGAGMAGISAAARLAQRGMSNFVLLEAYERPGGRIHSCWLGDVVAELGAHWRPQNDTLHPVETMAISENPPLPNAPGVEHSRGLFNRVNTVSSTRMDLPPIVNAYYKFRQIEKEATQIYCLGGSKQHGSLINFMSMRIQQELHEFPVQHQHDAARVMFGLSHMLSARSGDDIGMICADHLGCFMNMPGGEVRVPLGLSGILAPLLREIPEGVIRYCKPVNCIYWGTNQKIGYRATVCTTDGEEFPADYVIVTVSLGVLGANSGKMFCPALPSSKIDAIRALGVGHSNKIYMEFCRPFWYWHNGNLNFKYTDKSTRSDWTRGVTAIELVPQSKHVMCAWIVGDEAAFMESLSDRDIVEGLTGLLRNSTGNPYIPYPCTLLRSHWTSDPYFFGAYSFECDCSDGKAQYALACPLPGPGESIPPILLFAGEATVVGHNGTVHGARLSGIREAERVVQLTLYHKGPPLPYEPVKACVQKN